MSDAHDFGESGSFASPACSMKEFEALLFGETSDSDPAVATEVEAEIDDEPVGRKAQDDPRRQDIDRA